jgi:hypothetical protein
MTRRRNLAYHENMFPHKSAGVVSVESTRLEGEGSRSRWKKGERKDERYIVVANPMKASTHHLSTDPRRTIASC